MIGTLLFNESPILGFGVIFISALLLTTYKFGSFIFIIILVILMIFYRYESCENCYADNIIISPAEGLITNIHQKGEYVHISIFLSIFNRHTQIYPVNGEVINRVYDRTGKFNIAVTMDKSRYNEKKIHTIKMKNGNIITVTQIAGFLPRAINSSDLIPQKIKAGEYLGIIKFGSRVDLLFPGNIDNIKVKLNDNIKLGDVIYDV